VVDLQRINPDWTGEPCIVAAPGPSLTAEVAHCVRMARMFDRWRAVAVQDAYKLMPWADALYGSCPGWWRVHGDCRKFEGEMWSTHEDSAPNAQHLNDKGEFARLRLNLVRGTSAGGFSFDPGLIHYGSNSGFQAINLALLKGCTRIVLVGFDMRLVAGQSHFFGDHPKPLHQNRDQDYRNFVRHFDRAAKKLPPHVSIVNATPGSALTSFLMMSLDDALRSEVSRPNDRLSCDRPELQPAAS
jgi:hypothetical protein